MANVFGTGTPSGVFFPADTDSYTLATAFSVSGSGLQLSGLRIYLSSGGGTVTAGQIATVGQPLQCTVFGANPAGAGAVGPALVTPVDVSTVVVDGWNEVPLSAPLALTDGVVYYAAVRFRLGRYAAVSEQFASSVVAAPITLLQDGLTVGGHSVRNGAFILSTTPTPPTSSFRRTWYGIDVEVVPASSGAADVSAAVVARAVTVPAPTVAASAGVAASLVARVATIPVPAVASSATVGPPAVAAAASVPAPTVLAVSSGTTVPVPLPRGVNVAGVEFGVTGDGVAGVWPGTYGEQWLYDSPASVAYLAGRGIRSIRLPLAWERLQPVRNGALDSAESARVVAFLDSCAANGVGVLLEAHAYARFREISGTTRVLGVDLTAAELADFWVRLVGIVGSHPAVAAYELMNEPHDLPSGFTPAASLYTWDAGTTEAWAVDGDPSGTVLSSSAVAQSGAGSLRATKVIAGAGFGQVFRLSDDRGGDVRDLSANGDTVSVWVLIPTGTPGSGFAAKLSIQNSSYQYQQGPDVSLTPGVWTQITYAPPVGTLAAARSIVVQVSGNFDAAGTLAVHIDTMQLGSATSGAQLWEQATQTVTAAIRGTGDTHPIYVPGYSWQSAERWPEQHAAPWVTDPANNLRYAAHLYLDENGGGTYALTFAQEQTAAIGAGFVSVAARAVYRIHRFLDWCELHGVNSALTEIGWPDGADAAAWNAVGEVVYAELDVAASAAFYWATGEFWGTGYPLSAYRNAGSGPLSVANTQAAVIEAHLAGDGIGVAAATAVPAVTVTASATATPGAVSVSVAVPVPAVAAGSSASVTAVRVAATVQVPAPVARAGALTLPGQISRVVVIPAPSVRAGSTVQALGVLVAASVLAPAVQAQAAAVRPARMLGSAVAGASMVHGSQGGPTMTIGE